MRLRVLLLVLAVGVALGSGLLVVSVMRHAAPPAEVAAARHVMPATAATPLPDPAPPPSAPPAATSTPAPTPTPTPTPDPVATPVSDPDLQARLTALLTDPDLPGEGRLGVSVVDGHGRPLFAHDGDRALIPASTVKLATAAAALLELGPNHRFRTEVRATVAPDRDGIVDGDLVLVGGGDPALATPTFSAEVHSIRPRTPLADLAAAVRAAGVRRVRGDLVGDSTWLPDEPLAAGWPERYLANGDATRSSGLTVDAGRRLFTANGRLVSAPADDPALEAAAALVELLEEHGVTVDGAPTATAEPTAAAHHIAAVDSPALVELLRFTVQRSDNHLADAIFRSLGRAVADGSWASGTAAVRATLEPLGLDWAGVVLADGSGLSRDDRLSADFLVQLDVAMTRVLGARWQELMAVSGESGTLRRRLGGTVAAGRVLGKTGSLRDVRSLSGAVTGPQGRRYHFAVIGNGLAPEEDAAVRVLQDELVLALTEDLYECVWVTVAGDDDADVGGVGVRAGEPAGAEEPGAVGPDGTPAPGDEDGADGADDEPVVELRCAA